MNQQIRVLLGDDNPFSRNGLRALLETCQYLELVGVAHDGEHALTLVQEHTPDVVLLDVKMPKINGLQAARRIKLRWPEVRVILISMYSGYQPSALEAGADYFFLKGAPSSQLMEAILGPSNGKDCLDQRVKQGGEDGIRGKTNL